MSDLSVTPSKFSVSTKEKLPLSFDTTPLLLAGESPTSPSVLFIQLDTGANVPAALLGSPSIVGNIITQTVIGTGLTPGKSYRMEVTFNDGSTKTWDMELTVVCPF